MRAGEIAVSNMGLAALEIWLEPWCDELELPARSTLTVSARPPDGTVAAAPLLEVVDGRLVVWAACPGTALVAIDGVEQDTGSRIIALPAAMFDLPVKAAVELMFGSHPAARPGGRREEDRAVSWAGRLRRWWYRRSTPSG